MAVKIKFENNKVILEYRLRHGFDYMEQQFSNDEYVFVEKTFYLSKKYLENQITEDSKVLMFCIGYLNNDYYEVYKEILDTKFDVLIHKSCNISEDHFIFIVGRPAKSIIKRFEELANQKIIIGGIKENSIPEDVFNSIIDTFPTSTELEHYKDSRITNVLSEYLDGVKDSSKSFNDYVNKKNKKKKFKGFDSLSSINKYEYEKYKFLLDKLKNMLNKSNTFSENEWRKEILKIILILFPKYIEVLEEVKILDYYTDKSNPKPKDRYIDIALLDSNYNIDLIEIKIPSHNSIITNKPYNRDNYVPMRELSSTVMQVEKYIFHLNKWGIDGEKTLSSKYAKDIKITNPKGLLILGRDEGLDDRQKLDFEIIKRKYANVVDIITYDDLVRRLENLLIKFKI